MIGAAHRYIELITELLLERARLGGPLGEELEDSYAEQLDRCWHAMTKAEREDAEQVVTASSLEGPSDLKQADTNVSRGAKELPRKKQDQAA